jgi:hypothetical protein
MVVDTSPGMCREASMTLPGYVLEREFFFDNTLVRIHHVI